MYDPMTTQAGSLSVAPVGCRGGGSAMLIVGVIVAGVVVFGLLTMR
jgi:hypothetical protein